jgi:hypothetical protein
VILNAPEHVGAQWEKAKIRESVGFYHSCDVVNVIAPLRGAYQVVIVSDHAGSAAVLPSQNWSVGARLAAVVPSQSMSEGAPLQRDTEAVVQNEQGSTTPLLCLPYGAGRGERFGVILIELIGAAWTHQHEEVGPP